MKNKEYLKKYLIQILITIMAFLMIFLLINQIQDREYKKNFNYKINAILKVVQEKYPKVKKEEVIDILNSENNEGNVLLDYGYDLEKDFFVEQNNKLNLKYFVYEKENHVFGCCCISAYSMQFGRADNASEPS